MSEVDQILRQAEKLGLTIRIENNRIAITPSHRCKTPLLDRFKRHKAAIMARLQTPERKDNIKLDSPGGQLKPGILSDRQDDAWRASFLPPDEQAWLPIAAQVLAGEFDQADGSMIESIIIGLRNIKHSDCKKAAKVLERLQGR